MNDVARLGIEVDSSSAAKAVVDLDQLPGAAQRAERGVEGVGRKSTLMGGAVDRATRSIRGMFGAFAAGAAAAMSFNAIISTLSGFEQSMASVAAVTRASSGDLAAMRDIAKQLGATTEFTASQAADGLKFLGMAGFDAQKSIAALPSVLDLATAASMGLADSADITSNIMSAFGVAADGAGAVADVLAAAASRSNTDVYQLGDAMKYAGPVAAALGLDIGKAAAAAGTLSDAGIQGSMAGTGLRRVLSALTNPTNEAAKALQRLGINVNDVNPATKELTDIVDLLRERGLGASEALTIFGDRGGPAILALVENNQKLRELTGIMSDVEGEASRMANTIRDNFAGDLKGMASAAESVMIALGEVGLTGALRAMTQVATAALRAVAENMDRLATYAGVAAVAVGVALRGAIFAAATAAWGFVSALVATRAALIRTGMGALIVLAGELVYQLTRLIEETGGWGHALDALGNLASGVWKGITTSAKAIPPALQAVWLDMQAQFYLALAQMKAAWNDFISIFEQPALVVTIGGQAHELIGGLDLSAWKYDLDSAGDAAGRLQGRANELRQTASALATEGFDQVTEAAKRFADAMTRSTWLDTDMGPDNISAEWSRFNAIAGSVGGSSGGGVGAAVGASAQLNAYQEATKAVLNNIAALEQQGLTFGMTEMAAARFNTAMDLLRAAQEAGIPITDALIGEINGLADAYARADQQARVLQQQQQLLDQAASRTASGMTDAFEGLIAGGKEFGDVINSLIRDLGRMFLNQGFQALLGGALGGFNPLGFLGGFFGGPSFDGGGHTGSGPRSGGLDGRGGFLAMMHPNETVIDHSRGQAANQNQKLEVTVNVNGATGNTEVKRMVAEGVAQGMKAVEQNFGGMLADYNMRNG